MSKFLFLPVYIIIFLLLIFIWNIYGPYKSSIHDILNHILSKSSIRDILNHILSNMLQFCQGTAVRLLLYYSVIKLFKIFNLHSFKVDWVAMAVAEWFWVCTTIAYSTVTEFPDDKTWVKWLRDKIVEKS